MLHSFGGTVRDLVITTVGIVLVRVQKGPGTSGEGLSGAEARVVWLWRRWIGEHALPGLALVNVNVPCKGGVRQVDALLLPAPTPQYRTPAGPRPPTQRASRPARPPVPVVASARRVWPTLVVLAVIALLATVACVVIYQAFHAQ